MHADDDLMRTVFDASSFQFLDSLRSSEILKTFEKILASTIDENDDYQRLRDEGLRNALNSLEMGLVLAGQSITIIENLTLEVDEVDQPIVMEVDMTSQPTTKDVNRAADHNGRESRTC